ncbi:MAG: acyl-CoA dehydrogenase [Gammaproteobacteria bacterium]|nr:MAG: acyl-CoA dehydrogenase [Gammaproteobacteria bacterium]
MTPLFWILSFLLIIFLALYFRVQLWATALAIVALLAGWTWLAQPGAAALTLAWGAFALLTVPIAVVPIRRALFSRRIFAWFRSVVPSISDTEREALDAGTVWWDAELFTGKPDWKMLLSTPAPHLSDEERAFLDGPVDELCDMLDNWEITHELKDLPPAAWEFIKTNGFFGMIIPKEYGGLGFSAQAQSEVVMKISSRSVTAAVTVMVPNSLGPGELLMHYGTEAQKNHYLPRLARGQDVPCFALTSPTAGSDAGAIPDTGVICKGKYKGKEVLGLRLNWDKRYITLAPVATVLGLAFKAEDPDHLLGDEESLGITCALIPVDTPGITIGNRHLPVGAAFMNGPTQGKDVFIPLDYVIGGPDWIGKGWRMLMQSLAVGRSISLPALSTASGKMASLATGAYARIRKQFKIPIGYFEGVEEALTRIAGYSYRMDASRLLTLVAIDEGQKPAVLGAILKYHTTETMRHIVADSMDIHGGKGIIRGPRNYLAHAYQTIPISITVEGANILTRSMIIFGQGAIRCHPYILREMRSVDNPDPREGLRDFDRAFWAHIGFTMSNAFRAFVLAITAGRLLRSPVNGPTARYYKQVTRMSAAFAFVADVTMLMLGGKLKFKEKLSGRLGDILSHLYMVSAMLKRFQDQGQPEEDLPLLHWACIDSLVQVQESLYDVFRNFPSPAVGLFLRGMTLPFGRPYKKPNDGLGKAVARLILSDTGARSRLTQGVFECRDPDDAVGAVLDAFDKVLAASDAEDKLRKALGIGVDPNTYKDLVTRGLADGVITTTEARLVREAQEASLRVIAVDDFPREYVEPGYTANEAKVARAG